MGVKGWAKVLVVLYVIFCIAQVSLAYMARMQLQGAMSAELRDGRMNEKYAEEILKSLENRLDSQDIDVPLEIEYYADPPNFEDINEPWYLTAEYTAQVNLGLFKFPLKMETTAESEPAGGR